MYAYSHSGLGDDSTTVDTSGIDLTSGVVIIGAIALIALLLMSGGDDRPTFERHPKSRAKGTRVTKKASPSPAREEAKEEKDDLRQEVIDGLMGQGATKAQATKAVRASKGNDFDTLFKNSINKIRGLAEA